MSDLASNFVKGFSFMFDWLGKEILVTGKRMERTGIYIDFYVYSAEFKRYMLFHATKNMIIPFTEASILSFATKTLNNNKEKFLAAIRNELSVEEHIHCVARTISSVYLSYHYNFDNYYNPATKKGEPKRHFVLSIDFTKEFQERMLPPDFKVNTSSEGMTVRLGSTGVDIEVRKPRDE